MSYLENDLELERNRLEQSLQISKNANIIGLTIWIMEILGQVYTRQGEIQQAVALLEESLAISRASYHADRIANKLLPLGDALRLQGDLKRAAACYRESLILQHKIGHLAIIPSRLEALAKIAVLRDQDEQVAKLFGAAQTGREQFGIPVPPVDVAEYDTNLFSLREKLGDQHCEKLLKEGRKMSTEDVVDYAIELQVD